MVRRFGGIASRENGETKKLLEELPIAIFMRHQREKRKSISNKRKWRNMKKKI